MGFIIILIGLFVAMIGSTYYLTMINNNTFEALVLYFLIWITFNQLANFLAKEETTGNSSCKNK